MNNPDNTVNNLDREEIGADGCGCPITAQLTPNGSEVEDTQRTEHRPKCVNNPVNFTEQQAADEAVLLLVRKLRRLWPTACIDLMERLPEGARDALTLADNRADRLRAADRRDGITRRFVTIVEKVRAELDAQGGDDA